MAEGTSETTRHVRLKPYNKQKRHLLRQFYAASGHRYRSDRGWYRVSLDMANELKKIRQVETDADSPAAFDICSEKEAYEIDLKERAPVHQALATRPLDYVGGNASDKPAPTPTLDEDEDDDDDDEGAGGDGDGAVDIADYNVKNAKVVIAETDDVKTLERWLEEDGRKGVADAIEKRLDELDKAEKDADAAGAGGDNDGDSDDDKGGDGE